VPAAAVIPAPEAYAKVVAVKKLVVEFLVGLTWRLDECPFSCASAQPSSPFSEGVVHCNQIRVFKAGRRPECLLWDDKIGLGCYFVGLHT